MIINFIWYIDLIITHCTITLLRSLKIADPSLMCTYFTTKIREKRPNFFWLNVSNVFPFVSFLSFFLIFCRLAVDVVVARVFSPTRYRTKKNQTVNYCNFRKCFMSIRQNKKISFDVHKMDAIYYVWYTIIIKRFTHWYSKFPWF